MKWDVPQWIFCGVFCFGKKNSSYLNQKGWADLTKSLSFYTPPHCLSLPPLPAPRRMSCVCDPVTSGPPQVCTPTEQPAGMFYAHTPTRRDTHDWAPTTCFCLRLCLLPAWRIKYTLWVSFSSFWSAHHPWLQCSFGLYLHENSAWDVEKMDHSGIKIQQAALDHHLGSNTAAVPYQCAL